jgi:predicted nucleic acid-binding Zn ribbon protein
MSYNDDSNHFRRPKKSQLSKSAEVLHGLFSQGKDELSLQFLRWKLWKKWSEYVGPSISAHSEPVAYRRGVLYVWVESSAWMQQLIFMRQPLKEKINGVLGINYVKEIQLTLDRKSVPGEAESQEQLKKAIENIDLDSDV